MSPTWPLELLRTMTLVERDGKTTLTVDGIPTNATEEERQTFLAGPTQRRLASPELWTSSRLTWRAHKRRFELEHHAVDPSGTAGVGVRLACGVKLVLPLDQLAKQTPQLPALFLRFVAVCEVLPVIGLDPAQASAYSTGPHALGRHRTGHHYDWRDGGHGDQHGCRTGLVPSDRGTNRSAR